MAFFGNLSPFQKGAVAGFIAFLIFASPSMINMFFLQCTCNVYGSNCQGKFAKSCESKAFQYAALPYFLISLVFLLFFQVIGFENGFALSLMSLFSALLFFVLAGGFIGFILSKKKIIIKSCNIKSYLLTGLFRRKFLFRTSKIGFIYK